MNSKAPAILWLREHNLRMMDNAALHAAAAESSVLPVFIHDETEPSIRKMGEASKWWLHHALASLKRSLQDKGADLLIFKGNSEAVLMSLCRQLSAEIIYFQKSYIHSVAARDQKLKSILEEANITLKQYAGFLLFDPDSIKTNSDSPYKVFTPFWKACLQQKVRIKSPLPAPLKITLPSNRPKDDGLEALQLLPMVAWYEGLKASWDISETAAYQRLHQFLENDLAHYSEGRDFPSRMQISRLSPYLHFGMISPRVVYHQVQSYVQTVASGLENAANKFLSELGWREFSSYLLYHFPQMETQPFREEFKHFSWQSSPTLFNAWTMGKTGYPLVDAGMRELWQTGFMHNRVRMVVASFLIKHLQIHWKEGEAWFWDTLVDADYGSNIANWQWVAGCGADAAPYFRVFNPILQSKKFEAEKYIRRYVPELQKLSDKDIHTPWVLDEAMLKKADITLGVNYPYPIIEHDKARKRALAAYSEMKAD